MLPTGPIKIEMFSCSGGMAEGFRRAGITFDMAIEYAPDHCDSYETNLGHRPICMDVRDFLRMLQHGFRVEVSLLVADPPCTPWSRAGKRQGTEDERDMVVETVEIIKILRPRAYLIGNVPGLDDSSNWHIVQRELGKLAAEGYCVADYASLDAANYGVPQHRVRPFWYGHLGGECIRWPAPTHGDPTALTSLTLPGVDELRPWVTCKEALGHLTLEELGRPVKLRRRDAAAPKESSRDHSDFEGGYTPSKMDAPAKTIVRNTHGDGSVLLINDKHPPASMDEPSQTIGAKYRGQSGQVLTVEMHHPPSYADEPAKTVRAGDGGGANRSLVLNGDAPTRRRRERVPQSERAVDADRPATVITAKEDRVGSGTMLRLESPAGKSKRSQGSQSMEWPWNRPATTIQRDERMAPPGHKDEAWSGGIMSLPGAVVLSERAATILQGFPDGTCACERHAMASGRLERGLDVSEPRGTCRQCGEERRAWRFAGESKKARWSQIGQAMPPGLSSAVARSVARQMELPTGAAATVTALRKRQRKRSA